MMYIKRFIDKMSLMESKQAKDVVLSVTDARGLRDDIMRLLSDLHELKSNGSVKNSDIVQVEIKGGSFK